VTARSDSNVRSRTPLRAESAGLTPSLLQLFREIRQVRQHATVDPDGLTGKDHVAEQPVKCVVLHRSFSARSVGIGREGR